MRWLRWLLTEIQWRKFLDSMPWEPVDPLDEGPWYEWPDGELRREPPP